MRKFVLLLPLMAACLAAQTIRPLTGYEGSQLNRQALDATSAVGTKQPIRSASIFPGDSVIPQFVDGNTWATEVTITNLETRRLTASVLFIGDDGNDMYVDIVGHGRSRGLDLTMDPMTTVTFATTGVSATTAQGFAVLKRELSGDAVSGMAIFRQRVPGRPDFEAAVPISSEFEDEAVLLYDNTAAFGTGLAYANPFPYPLTITVEVRTGTGTTLAVYSVDVPAYRHSAGMISDLFPETRGRRGLLHYRVTGGPITGLGLGVLGLRFNPAGSFTSFQTLCNLDWTLQ